jgi:hypothetical protein
VIDALKGKIESTRVRGKWVTILARRGHGGDFTTEAQRKQS